MKGVVAAFDVEVAEGDEVVVPGVLVAASIAPATE